MRHATKIASGRHPVSMDLTCLPIKYRYDKVQRYGKNFPDEHGEKVGVAVRELPVSCIVDVLNALPDNIKALEIPEVIVMEFAGIDGKKSVVAPHVDVNRLCAINFYIDAHGEITSFYAWDEPERLCKEVESMVALSGDVWLLDTSVPHSVFLVKDKVRRIISCSFTCNSYETIREALLEST